MGPRFREDDVNGGIGVVTVANSVWPGVIFIDSCNLA